MKTLTLLNGSDCLVDDGDFDWLSKWEWSVFRLKGHKDYAYRWARNDDGKRFRVFMHRAILGREATDHTDHKDGNGLNNQRFNLRAATCSQNLANRGPQANNTSGFKGVTWNKRLKKWVAAIRHNGKSKHLGVFEDPLKAAECYNLAAVIRFRDFAWTNRTD